MYALLLIVLAAPAAGDAGGYGTRYGDFQSIEEASHAGECGAHGHTKGQRGGWLGPMPQSCYNPSFGCYPSTRHMHRYPAFHGSYYRRAYNYRNTFDYPWHGGLHEPTSHFSYNVPDEAVAPLPAPIVGPNDGP
jgi:hypothetical protein